MMFKFKKFLAGLLLSGAAMAQTAIVRQNSLTLGRGTGTNKQLIFDNGSGAANPRFRWNNASSVFEFANDGTTFSSFTATTDASAQLSNMGLTGTVAASALTVALKDKSGANATSLTPIYIGFRNSTATTGQYALRSVTGALSMVVSSGSTLGFTSTVPQYVYVYAIDNAGTVELAVSSTIFDEGTLQNTTAEGGAGAADSIGVLYSTTARTGVPIRLVGRLKLTEATAGTWATAPAEISLSPLRRIFTPTIQRYTSGSGTYTIPIGATYLHIRAAGGGGGGAGGGTANGTAPTAGTATTMGAFLSAGGGSFNQTIGGAGGGGGSASVTSPCITIVATDGNAGGGGTNNASALISQVGGFGGSTPFFGGGGVSVGGGGGSAGTSSGAGGGGGGTNTTASSSSGPGGGSGAYIDCILPVINAGATSFSYSIGTAGTGGGAGTSGRAGANGVVGTLIIEEHYDN